METASPRVLILDDDSDTAEMYAIALSQAGYETVEAHSPEDALPWVLEETPAVVVTDLAVPGRMDGLEFTRRLRRNERTRAILIIVVTGLPHTTYREAAQRAGCDMFLPKPCLPDELALCVRRALAGAEASAYLGIRPSRDRQITGALTTTALGPLSALLPPVRVHPAPPARRADPLRSNGSGRSTRAAAGVRCWGRSVPGPVTGQTCACWSTISPRRCRTSQPRVRLHRRSERRFTRGSTCREFAALS